MTESSIRISGVNRLDTLPDFAACKRGVVEILAYFDIFHYPLTVGEIRQFLPVRADEILLHECLNDLLEDKIIFCSHGFYSIQNNPFLAHRRKEGNQLAEKLLAKALRIGRFLYQFPFVRAVGISGSLSKNYADEKADIDFFIIAKANRLWIARTLMHLYKKLTFLSGRQHFYCMNYYIDEKALPLEERNIFTAIEIKTLLPVCGEETFRRFFGANVWAGEYLPACNFRSREEKDPGTSLFKKFHEWILGGKAGNHLENYFFRLTRDRWKKKTDQGKRNKKGHTMDLITGKHFARSNPGAFQEKVLALYEKKMAGIEQPGFQGRLIVSSVK